MKMHFLLIALLLFSWIPVSCNGKGQETFIINDFETDEDLDRLFWQCKTLFSLSSANPSHGKTCLKMEMFPSAYPGVACKDYEKNWTGYAILALDIFNPPENHGRCRITLRIDDQEKSPPYDDRYNGSFLLEPGMNRLKIPVGELKTPRGRRLDPSRIHRVVFFMMEPEEKKVLFVDYVRLVK